MYGLAEALHVSWPVMTVPYGIVVAAETGEEAKENAVITAMENPTVYTSFCIR